MGGEQTEAPELDSVVAVATQTKYVGSGLCLNCVNSSNRRFVDPAEVCAGLAKFQLQLKQLKVRSQTVHQFLLSHFGFVFVETDKT